MLLLKEQQIYGHWAKNGLLPDKISGTELTVDHPAIWSIEKIAIVGGIENNDFISFPGTTIS
jgi:hypothetical protein